MAKPPTLRLDSSADFARRAGVSRSAISQALRGKLAGALVDDRINIDHPDAIAYLVYRGKFVPPARGGVPPARGGVPPKTARAPTPSGKRPVWIPDPPPSPRGTRGIRRRKPTEDGPEEVLEAPENIIEELDELAALLRPIIDRWGTERRVKDWLSALETLERIQEKHLGNEETKANLIARDLVSNQVFGAFRSLTQKLLRDFPKTIGRRLYSLHQAKAPLEEAEGVVREMLTKHIKDVKARIERGLKPPE